MFSILALASAAFYGAADFIGGLASRRADTLAIVVVSQSAGLLVVALALPFFSAPLPRLNDWLWGAAAGIAGGGGVALLYRALAIGVMSLVAPVTAVCAVAVPVLVAVSVMGERPPIMATVGIALALVAVVLVSQTSGDSADVQERKRGLGLAIASGILIGFFFLALARTSRDAGLWPLLAARLSSVCLFAGMIVLSRRSVVMPVRVTAIAVGGGMLDMVANLLYLLASRIGPLTLVVTLSTLYPASTVLLARFVLHERLTFRQWAGVALALAAIFLIVA
jgi:drug/metabolite transporter (DMT)-like permease